MFFLNFSVNKSVIKAATFSTSKYSIEPNVFSQ